jgi:hypothetical protein
MDPSHNVRRELLMFDKQEHIFKMHYGSTGAVDQRQKGGN